MQELCIGFEKIAPNRLNKIIKGLMNVQASRAQGGIYVDDGVVQELVQLAAVRRMMVLHS
jgi:hypothetical protein